MCTTTIRLQSDLIADAKKSASKHFRTAAKQIEYWAHLGRLAEENSDLPLDFIEGCIDAKNEGEVSKGVINLALAALDKYEDNALGEEALAREKSFDGHYHTMQDLKSACDAL